MRYTNTGSSSVSRKFLWYSFVNIITPANYRITCAHLANKKNPGYKKQYIVPLVVFHELYNMTKPAACYMVRVQQGAILLLVAWGN